MLPLLLLAPALLAGTGRAGLTPGFRPPCAPLNVVSPYQSVWSCSDHLYDSMPQHWDGSTVGLFGAVRVDGASYRFMGNVPAVPAAVQQTGLSVAPATTTYDFAAAGVSLRVRFSTPAIGLDADIVRASRPVTDVTFTVESTDGKAHAVQLYYDNTAEGAVKDINAELVSFSRLPAQGARNNGSAALTIMQAGTKEQKEMAQGSDKINWGYWLVSTPTAAQGLHTAMAPADEARAAFAKGTYFGLADDVAGEKAAADTWRVMSVGWDLGQVGAGGSEERHLTLAYDQVVAQRYFGTDMAPLWRKQWGDAASLLQAAEESRAQDLAAIAAFDSDLVSKLAERGGDKFATIASLVYRQVIGGTQAVLNPVTGEEWVFMKEISSDGDVSTVDVVYPAFPLFQYLYPEYFRKLMVPLLVYGNNETKAYGLDMPYNLAWAPHHLGHWPVCDLKPQAQEQMPIEESGNMLIMLAAIYKVQKDASYLKKYWPMLDSWADYIVASLPDPGNQLCTDDFEGPSPHNTNLAAKGIVGLAAYADLVQMRGDAAKAQAYRDHAADFVKKWMSMADDGDHFRIQFNLPGTWSLKYNLLYQKSLGLSAFPEAVLQAESAYYQTKLKPCGVPLDNRHPYTKSDWSMWSAVLGNRAQFDAIVNGLYTFANTTSGRVPLSDFYNVETCGLQGFRARPVQGGLYAPMVVEAVEAVSMIHV